MPVFYLGLCRPLSPSDLRTLSPLAMDLILKQMKQFLGNMALGFVPTIGYDF